MCNVSRECVLTSAFHQLHGARALHLHVFQTNLPRLPPIRLLNTFVQYTYPPPNLPSLDSPYIPRAMAGKQPGFLFKQTRVNLDWSEKKSPITVEVVLPEHPGRARKSLSLWKKEKTAFSPDDYEEKFKLSQYAQDASIYYRLANRFPRCILWRVLNDWQTLSISSVDFTRNESQADFSRTYLFKFPEAINEHGSVGFADAPDHDELVVYVLTTGKVLYTLRLTSDLFTKSPRELHPADFCTTFVPSSFINSPPHLLRAVNDRSLVVALQDGSLMKLTRQGQSGRSVPAFYLAHY